MVTNRFSLSGKLLIVDDEPASYRSIQTLLKPYELSIHFESGFSQLTTRLRSDRYDIILLRTHGLRNGEMRIDGITILQQILMIDSSAVVIMIASELEGEAAIRAIEYGATDFIVIPWQSEKLLATLNAAVALRVTRSQVESLRRGQPLPQSIVGTNFSGATDGKVIPLDSFNLDLVEKEVIVRALLHYKGNIKRSAKELGVTRTTLYRRLEKYGL